MKKFSKILAKYGQIANELGGHINSEEFSLPRNQMIHDFATLREERNRFIKLPITMLVITFTAFLIAAVFMLLQFPGPAGGNIYHNLTIGIFPMIVGCLGCVWWIFKVLREKHNSEMMIRFALELDATALQAVIFTLRNNNLKNLDQILANAGHRQPKTTILFLAANPGNMDLLRLDKEIRGIDQALEKSKYGSRFNLVSSWAVQISDIERLISRHNPAVIHFSGHASESGEIIFENNDNIGRPVAATALAEFFEIIKGKVQLVVLNACFSESSAQLVAESVPFVVGTQNAIEDSNAISFAEAFYSAIGNGNDIPKSFQFAQNRLNMENSNGQEILALISSSKKSMPDNRHGLIL